jgi:hypothetical protein
LGFKVQPEQRAISKKTAMCGGNFRPLRPSLSKKWDMILPDFVIKT